MTTGTLLNALLGLLFYVLAARYLGVNSFGVFSFFLGVAVLGAELGNLGFGQALVRFGHGREFRAVFSVCFMQAAAVSVVLMALAILAGVFTLTNFVFSAFAASSLLFVSVHTQSFLAREEFYRYAGTNIFGNIIRLFLLGALKRQGFVSAEYFLLAFAGANFSAALLAFAVISLKENRLPFDFTGFVSSFRKIADYGGWLGASFGAAALAGKIDIPLIYSLAGAEAVGIYSAAQKLVSVIPQIAASLEGVFAPKFSKKENFAQNFREYLIISLVFGLSLLILLFFSAPILTLIFGPKYKDSVKIFNLLILGLVFLVISGPFATKVLYFYSKSKYHFFNSLVQLFLTLTLLFIFVPKYQEVGAAIVFILVNFVSALIFGSMSRAASKND